MTHIKRIDEMAKLQRSVNESYDDESFLDFFGVCAKMTELYKFDKLCPDLDYGESEFSSAMSEFGIDDVGKIGKAYYLSIFDTYVRSLVDEGEITEEEAEKIEMDYNPIEFHYEDEYFNTTEELMKIIQRKRAE